MHLPINAPSNTDSLSAFLAPSITALCATPETRLAFAISATSNSSLTTLHPSITPFSISRFFSSKPRNVTPSDTCPGMANTVLDPWSARRASTALTSLVNLTSSTSHLRSASSGETGRPIQMTSSGLMGGMKSVERSVAMS